MERPIIFSGEMVRAILDGRKTQTRRVIRPQPPEPHVVKVSSAGLVVFDHKKMQCPYGLQGDHLWVRETLRRGTQKTEGPEPKFSVQYAATCTPMPYQPFTGIGYCGYQLWDWKRTIIPSIHMPRWASRITLEITGVRVEKLQALTVRDAQEEGFYFLEIADGHAVSWRTQFKKLWDSLNAKRGYGWDVNPFVWVIEFRVLACVAVAAVISK